MQEKNDQQISFLCTFKRSLSKQRRQRFFLSYSSLFRGREPTFNPPSGGGGVLKFDASHPFHRIIHLGNLGREFNHMGATVHFTAQLSRFIFVSAKIPAKTHVRTKVADLV